MLCDDSGANIAILNGDYSGKSCGANYGWNSMPWNMYGYSFLFDPMRNQCSEIEQTRHLSLMLYNGQVPCARYLRQVLEPPLAYVSFRWAKSKSCQQRTIIAPPTKPIRKRHSLHSRRLTGKQGVGNGDHRVWREIYQVYEANQRCHPPAFVH